MRKKIIIIMTAIVLFGGFIAGYRNINQKYPARKVETAEKGEFLEFLDGCPQKNRQQFMRIVG